MNQNFWMFTAFRDFVLYLYQQNFYLRCKLEMRYYSYDIWYFVDKFIDSAIEGNFMKWFFALFRKSFYLLWYLDWFILLLSSKFFFCSYWRDILLVTRQTISIIFFCGGKFTGGGKFDLVWACDEFSFLCLMSFSFKTMEIHLEAFIKGELLFQRQKFIWIATVSSLPSTYYLLNVFLNKF